MTDLRTAAEKALAFLEFYTLNDSAEEWRGNVADALRAALAAEAPQPPPLRFADIRELRTACAMQGLSQEFEELLARATAAPPQVQPLTDEQIERLARFEEWLADRAGPLLHIDDVREALHGITDTGAA